MINADVISRKVSTRDRNSFPLIGDAAAITILERVGDTAPIIANIKMDGARHAALMIPAGGFRQPSNPSTGIMTEDEGGNFRSLDHLVMDGTAVFNFVMTEVPSMIETLLLDAGSEIGSVDVFLFHQPNRFMLHKLADKLCIPYEKMPSNVVENFGNSSGVTIPLAITLNLRERLQTTSVQACLAGFGVGLTWGGMLMSLGPLTFCDMIDYP